MDSENDSDLFIYSADSPNYSRTYNSLRNYSKKTGVFHHLHHIIEILCIVIVILLASYRGKSHYTRKLYWSPQFQEFVESPYCLLLMVILSIICLVSIHFHSHY